MSDVEWGMERDGVRASFDEEGAKAERNRRWREENRVPLEAYAGEVAREGLALESFRSF